MKFLIVFLFSIQALAQVDVSHLSTEVSLRIERVPEFKFIKEEADKLGVKVYLFGGTASAFAHYVRWDLEREAGDEKYQAERFDYDFTNIYRGNQDLDIVVDGTAEQAAQLQQILKTKYPHFVGSKVAWEARLLRAEISDKLPLLDNPDFLNQHTDTNSTGMVAVNAEPAEIVFRDLFDWENPDSRFLNDVAAGRIKFLFSDSHKTTSRFKEGKNPPVFAAIRYLAKLAQYEVEGFEGDLEIIKKIVEETNWSEIKNNSYVKQKLEEFGKKVLLNAPDSEYAWNLLEETGLRAHLIEMDGNRINSIESLSWWMNKEPLRAKPLGEGNGETAAEIFKNHINEDGEIIVAHETNSFESYENITRSSRGAANAFISRDGVSGEVAALGDGFYTRLGLKGARGTNLTIRFKLNPDAREGEDFIYNGDFIVIKNKAALELIQENLNISMVDFLKLLASNSISKSDKGLKEKLLRKFNRSASGELSDAKSFLRDYFFIAKDFPEPFDFSVFEEAASFDVILNLFIKELQNYFRDFIPNFLRSNQDQLKQEWIEALVQKSIIDQEIAKYVLSQAYWKDHPELVQNLIDNGRADWQIAAYVLSKAHWKDYSELVQSLIDNGRADWQIAAYVLSQAHWSDHPELVQNLIDKGNADKEIAQYVLSQAHWKDHPEWVQTLIDKGRADKEIALYVLSSEHWSDHPELVQALIDNGKADKEIAQYVLSRGYWANHPQLRAYLNGSKVSVNNLRARGGEISFKSWLGARSLTCTRALR